MTGQGLPIVAVMTKTKPDLRPLARHLMDRCMKFYEDPENEKAFLEWKKERERSGRAEKRKAV